MKKKINKALKSCNNRIETVKDKISLSKESVIGCDNKKDKRIINMRATLVKESGCRFSIIYEKPLVVDSNTSVKIKYDLKSLLDMKLGGKKKILVKIELIRHKKEILGNHVYSENGEEPVTTDITVLEFL